MMAELAIVLADVTLSREIYGNIDSVSKFVFYLLVTLSMGCFAYGVYRKARYWKLGRPPRDRTDWRAGLRAFGSRVMTQRSVRQGPRKAGRVHALFFVGFVLLLIGTTLVAIEHYGAALLGREHGDPLFHYGAYYALFEVTLDAAGLLFLGGCLWFIRRRLAAKDSIAQTRLDWVVLSGLLLIGVTGYLLEGARILLESPIYPGLSFVGYGVSRLLAGMGVDPGGSSTVHLVLWWFHTILALGLIAAFPYTRLVHVITGALHLSLQPKTLGRLDAVPIEEVEETGLVGVNAIQEFTSRQLLALDACVSCGRCQDACPAFEAGKPLSPRDLVQDLRTHFAAAAPPLAAARRRKAGEEELLTVSPSLHDETVQSETLWSCTVCNACLDACPMAISPVGLITDLRRNRIAEGALRGPPATALQKVQRSGNPWGLPKQDRFAWADGLDVPTVKDNPHFEVLYWVGCAAAYDRRIRKVARAVVKLLQTAGVNFAVLGPEERCNGEFARRMGDEFLFQELADTTIQTLGKHKVRKIVTHCPHCLNSFRQDYPQFGGNYDVMHHSELLAELVAQGRLPAVDEARKGGDGGITFHDPCYLARVNRITEAPRDLIAACTRETEWQELPRNRTHTACCGAGGGRMWFDDAIDQRVGIGRITETVTSGSRTVAVACPFCLTMMTDGLAARAPDVQVRDVAELLAEALDAAPP